MDITAKIRSIMARKGITQTELSKRLGITQAAVSSQLNRKMRMDNFLLICEALEINPGEVFQDSGTDGTVTTAICPHCGKPLQITIK